ncbi:MAG: ATP-dependent DNA helicase RecG, partial [Synergistaceae bacterium]|nr:ATP-dependent DNA helicase RecG [Synergistaceae bacterium]
KPKAVKKLVHECLANYLDLIKDFLPEYIKDKYRMRDIKDAIRILHAPANQDLWLRARNRLSFDDLFLLQAGLFMRRNLNKADNAPLIEAGENYKKFFENLKFKPTGAQSRAINEILNDFKDASRSMNRLLQGDVGSGKTLVAAGALLAAVDSQFQAAFMAPTEILAQQHYLKIKNFNLGVEIALLTGSLSMSERKEILKNLASGEIKIVIGTHAIFSESVRFKNLGLVIIDEQHRFGVLQKQALIEKSGNLTPHVLVMTATPIPRTLTLSVFGDLDVSILDELPPGRKAIETINLTDGLDDKNKLYEIIKKYINNKNQVYWVCPLVEEGSDSKSELSSAVIRGAELTKIFSEFKIAVMHGRLSIEEKSKIMKDFADNKINILVSTVVIEVGVDVPNAALMVIEDAGQFGLAQLHQLRGRVGRGEAESMCILLTSQSTSPDGLERVKALTEIADGFELAEVDLKQRGPGEICGVRQHGVTEYRTANLVRDIKILNIARKEAKDLIERDPELKTEPLLRAEIMRRLGDELKLAETA